MSKWYKIGGFVFLAVAAIALVLSGVAYAQDETPTPEAAPGWFPKGHGIGFGPRGEVAMQAVADALGMDVEDLSTQLWGGKTIADLAEEKGVDLADVQAAVQAAQEQAMRDNIAQAVEDGNITQEHADWLLEGLDKGFIGAPGGFLGGRRHGMRGGMRGEGMFPIAPDTSSEGA